MPIPKYTKEHVLYFLELVEAGAFCPVIDRKYGLDEVVAATRFVETGQKVGNVVITVADDRSGAGGVAVAVSSGHAGRQLG